MFERRAMERIEIGQHGLLHVDGIRGCHPCRVVNFHSEPCFTHLRITRPPSDLICHWMASKRQGIAVVWRNGNTCGVKFVDQCLTGQGKARPASQNGTTPV